MPDQPRSGRHLDLGPEGRHRVMSQGFAKSQDSSNAWSLRQLSRALGIGGTPVHRIMNEGRLQPYAMEYWCSKSPDPEFEAQPAAIWGLCRDPPDCPW